MSEKHAKPQLLVELSETREKVSSHSSRGSETSYEIPKYDDNFDDIKDLDLESIIDTPQKHRMKKELRRRKFITIPLLSRKKIESLQRKVRQLNKRNA